MQPVCVLLDAWGIGGYRSGNAGPEGRPLAVVEEDSS